MSLDVHLEDNEKNVLFKENITHNLIPMAKAAGIYECLWCPEEYGMLRASQIIEPLAAGLAKLVAEPAKYEAFNASNGWGRWVDFVPWCENYLRACRDNPEATIFASR